MEEFSELLREENSTSASKYNLSQNLAPLISM
jgi:hypothetical protein